MDTVHTKANGEVTAMHGPDAVEIFRMATIVQGLKAEKIGMRLTRGLSCTKLAKQLTGLKTNDRDALIVAMQGKIAEQKSKVEYIADR